MSVGTAGASPASKLCILRLAGSAALGLALLWATLSFPGARAAEDDRELVKLPPMMQEHMLANMRDHLTALNEMLAELAAGKVEQATKIAESRLGMSSLETHGAAHMAPHMPKAMQEIGTAMHRAASRFAVAAQNAELEPGREAQHKVYEALQEITANCVACHQAYRIR
jgi:cytochrome c556